MSTNFTTSGMSREEKIKMIAELSVGLSVADFNKAILLSGTMLPVFGPRLTNLRGNRTVAEVSQAVGISEDALKDYEAGKRMPRDEVKKALAEYYNMTVDELFSI